MSHDNADKGTADRGGHRGDRRPYDARGGKRGNAGSRNGRPRGPGAGRGSGPGKHDGKPAARGRPGDRSGGRPRRENRDDRRGDGRPREGRRDFKRDDRRPVEAAGRPEPRLTIPSTPEKILFKGIDCEVNGKTGLAMKLYIHGAARLSGGCESNAQRLLRGMGPEEFPSVRGRIGEDAPSDVFVAFDYLCATVDESYPLAYLEEQAAEGNPLAVYELVRLGRVEGDSSLIDTLASHGDDSPDMVRDGLKLLVRKKDSASAAAHLKAMDERQRERQSIRPAFVRAMKGGSRKQLDELAGSFREAEFLAGYVDAEDREEYLREGMGGFQSTILAMAPELGISDTPFGKYLSAKRTQVQGDEWVAQMINAAIAGSDDAIGELAPIRDRRDVRKGLATMYLARSDAAGLVSCYDGEDAEFLDRYCAGDPERIVEIARRMGTDRAVAWLKRGYLKGHEECRDELVRMAGSGGNGGKLLVYALHDVGEELEAAKLYMSLYGDRSLPSVKWLGKVCADEEAKEFLRQRFEELGETAVYKSIFVDDGYVKGPKKGGKGPGRGGPKKGGRKPRYRCGRSSSGEIP